MSLEKPSVCPLDCPDTCSLTVTVADEQVIAVKGSRANPLTHGAICAKVAKYYPDFVHGANRLRYPHKRVGAKGAGKFARISWDEALGIIHERVSEVIDRYGPQAVLPFNYAGPQGMLAADSMSLRFFHKLGATQLKRNPLCGGIRTEAYAGTFGDCPGTPLQQVSLAKLIIVWGNNATACNLHLMRQINAAKRNGARLVVIDPRRIRAAEQANLHLAVRPGTDVVLAWSLAAELARIGGLAREFIAEHVLGAEVYMAEANAYPAERAAEICGVPADDIRTLARWYHEATPAIIAWGNGLERNQNGGSGVRAIAALPALAGNLGVPGGGIDAAAGNAFPTDSHSLTRPDLLPPQTRTINILDVAALLLDRQLQPPLKAMFIYNHNPLVVHPDQNRMRRALEREDLFTVGIEIALTDSMHYADVLLPACTHFEQSDLHAAYGQQYLQRSEPVIAPARRKPAQHRDLSPPRRPLRLQRSGIHRDRRATDGRRRRWQGCAHARGAREPRLPLDRALSMEYEGAEPMKATLFRNVWPTTPSGKIELQSALLGARYGAALPTFRPVHSSYPLTLISPASEKRITSTFGGLAVNDSTPVLEMHPADAAGRNLIDGIKHGKGVERSAGEVYLPLRITAAVRPGVVCSEKGAWLRTSSNRQTVSALAPSHKADLAEGACFNDARVEVSTHRELAAV